MLYKKGASQAPLSLNEAQEEALCFGWTDVMSRRIDDARYVLRFTPRRVGSLWSISNIRRVERLSKAGLMAEAFLQEVAE